MTRTDTLMRILRTDIGGFALTEVDTPEWLERFPAGFGPLPKLTFDPDVIEFCPTRILDLGRDLSDEQFDDFCRAIVCWQAGSAMSFALELPGDLAVLKFVDDFPTEGAFLQVMADRAGVPLVRFLGAHER